MELTGRSAVVTGGASGLGAATARALNSRGAQVFVVDRTKPERRDASVVAFQADVTSECEIKDVFDKISRSAPPLGVVVNCAGVAPARRIISKAKPHDLGLFRRVLDINLVGSFNVMAQGAALMSTSPPNSDGIRGVVVNTASIAAYEGQVGQAAYAASKGGVVALTLAAARDLASAGVRVCSIAPGAVDTPMLADIGSEIRVRLEAEVPLPARLCRPDEFAGLVLSIVGHDYLNGETVRMDGGLRMAPR